MLAAALCGRIINAAWRIENPDSAGGNQPPPKLIDACPRGEAVQQFQMVFFPGSSL
jgi:hypothetical protein